MHFSVNALSSHVQPPSRLQRRNSVGAAHPTDCCVLDIEVMTEDKPLIKDGEILELYATGVRDFTGYRLYIVDEINRVSMTPDLSGVNFSGLSLNESYVTGINLSGANLSGTRLEAAHLIRGNLSGANLSGASLFQAELSGVNLTGAVLENVNLRSAEISGCDLTNVSLVGADVERALINGCNLTNANLTGVNIENTLNFCSNVFQNTTMPDGSIRSD